MLDTDYDALEAALYEAALVPDRWGDVLDRLSSLAGGVGAAIWSANGSNFTWRASAGLHPITARFVESGWSRNNLRLVAARERALNQTPRFFTEADMFDSDDYVSDPFFADFLIPSGIGWSATTAINVPGHDLLSVSIERARNKGPVPAEALALLDRLRPHIARSALIAARLAFDRTNSSVEALEQLGYAAASISASGRVFASNAGFRAADGGWSISGDEQVVIEDEHIQAMLDHALSLIGTTGGVRSIALPGEGRKLSAVMHLLPIRGDAHDLFNRASALVVITRSSGGNHPAIIQSLFDLTPAEAVVAGRLGQGDTAEEIAQTTGRSILTVRTQIKSVLSKTGTRRQSELVQLLLRLVPPAL